MKRCVGVIVFLLMFNNVFADSMKFTDKFDAGGKKIKWLEVVSWEFDIKKDGFDPSSMEVTEASVELAVGDDNSDIWIAPSEFALLSIGKSQVFLWEVDTENYTFEISSLLTLNEGGLISVSLSSVFGDFCFYSSTLTAHATPEPSTVSLICFGFIGLLWYNCRKKKNVWILNRSRK